MDISSMLNDGPPANPSPTTSAHAERRSSARGMSISQISGREDSVSSTPPTTSITQSPKVNGHALSTPTRTPTSFDRPRSSDDRFVKPPLLPEKPEIIVEPEINIKSEVIATPGNAKRKRELSETGPKKKRLHEPPLWAQKIPERRHLGQSWKNLPRWNHDKAKSTNRGPAPEAAAQITAHKPQPSPAIISPINPFGSTYCNVVPGDEVVRRVADFLYVNIASLVDKLPSTNIEIEAKLGKILNRDTEERVVIPVQTEAVMAPNPGGMRTLFQSSMSEEEHMLFNKHLNESAILTPGPNGKTHERVLDIDTFWQMSRADAIANIPGHLQPFVIGVGNAPIKVRLTKAWAGSKTGDEKACIIKRRLNNIDIYNPNYPFDWRVSVNIEYEYTGPRDRLEPATEGPGARVRDRAKNRLKYFYPVCDIDFTKVTSVPHGQIPSGQSYEENEHELEVELHSARVYEQIDLLHKNSAASRYEDLVRVLVDNVRVLTRSLIKT